MILSLKNEIYTGIWSQEGGFLIHELKKNNPREELIFTNAAHLTAIWYIYVFIYKYTYILVLKNIRENKSCKEELQGR